VESAVQEVERLIGEGDAAVLAPPVRVRLVVVVVVAARQVGVAHLGGLLDQLD